MSIEQKDPRFRRLELKVGVMVVLALAGIIAVIAAVGMERGLFTKKIRIHFISPSGAGFVEGMPVKLSGFRIGRVRKTEFTEDANVRVTVEINRKYEKWLRNDSVARLSKEGFIGESSIEVTVGSAGENMLKDGAVIGYEKTPGMEDLINEAKPVLKEVKEIIHYANDPDGDIKAAMRNIRELTGSLKETGRSMDAAIRDADRLVNNINVKGSNVLDGAERTLKNLDGAAARLNPLMEKLEGIASNTGAAAAKLPGAVENADKILENVKTLTDILSDEGPRIRSILMDAHDAIKETGTAVKGIKQIWPLRLLLPPVKEPGLVPLDSYILKRKSSDESHRP
ncbi:MAG: MlaD family protein [Deltaproteobacteria bacterium]